MDNPSTSKRPHLTLHLPLTGNTVSCGFPSPAEEYIEAPLNLHDYLICKPAATFFVRAKGDSMTGAGIFDGDLLVVDRSITPRHDQIVVAILDGEFTLKRLYKKDGQIALLPENPNYSPIQIKDGTSFEVWGVAVHCIHKL